MPVVWAAGISAAATVVGSVVASDSARHSSNQAKDSANAATSAQERTAATANQLARDQFDDAKSQRDKYAPYYDKLLQQQVKAGEDNTTRSDKQWANYESLFQPIEAKVADDAMTYDSADKVAQRSDRAINDIDTQIAGQRGAAERGLARSGVDAGSGRGFALELNNSGAIARAAAGTKAANDSELQAIQLRAGAANFGRGLPNTGLSASGQAVSNAGAANGAIAAPQAQYNASVGLGLSALNTSIGANNSAGNLAGNNWAMANQQSQQQGSTIGTLAGLGGKLAMSYYNQPQTSQSAWTGGWSGSGTNGLGTTGPVGGTSFDPAYG
jgi:hypothetical protein